MYIYSMKNINFKNVFALIFFGVQCGTENKSIKTTKTLACRYTTRENHMGFFGKYHAHKHGHYICSWFVGWNNSIKISSRIYIQVLKDLRLNPVCFNYKH